MYGWEEMAEEVRRDGEWLRRGWLRAGWLLAREYVFLTTFYVWRRGVKGCVGERGGMGGVRGESRDVVGGWFGERVAGRGEGGGMRRVMCGVRVWSGLWGDVMTVE